jgi:alpha-D-ribose 1-methylphosphonate 5-phosphate C-P lyase
MPKAIRNVPPRFGFGSGDVRIPASVAGEAAADVVDAEATVGAGAGVGGIGADVAGAAAAGADVAAVAGVAVGVPELPQAARKAAIVPPENPAAASRLANCRRLNRPD